MAAVAKTCSRWFWLKRDRSWNPSVGEGWFGLRCPAQVKRSYTGWGGKRSWPWETCWRCRGISQNQCSDHAVGYFEAALFFYWSYLSARPVLWRPTHLNISDLVPGTNLIPILLFSNLYILSFSDECWWLRYRTPPLWFWTSSSTKT